MSSILGERLRLSVFGQSHGAAIGVVLDGLPAGEVIDTDALQVFMERRGGGRNEFSTSRKEADVPRFLSGVVNGMTCGAPLCAVLENNDVRSEDYNSLHNLMRPSHSDYPAFVRYGGKNDVRGGGHFSGRLTAALCAAGGIAKQVLEHRGIFVGAHAEMIGQVRDRRFETIHLTREELLLPGSRPIPVLDEAAGEQMRLAIMAAKEREDSVGGIVECGAIGMPVGVGDPMFDGMENRLAAALFGIPAVRGVEFGLGFAASELFGSQHNDPYAYLDGSVVAQTNNHGGILGGMTSGMPIIFRVAFKPTASIGTEQQTVDVAAGQDAPLTINGRHDPCIALRAVPVVEAMASLVLLDSLLIAKGYDG